MGKGSSGGGGTQQVNTTSTPPPQFMNAYSNLVNQAGQVGSQPLQQYSGNMISGFSPSQQQAMQTIDQSQGVANPYINAAAQMTAAGATPIQPQQFSSGAVQQYISPYTQNVVDSTQAQFNNQNQQQNQQLIGNAISKGAWGGDRAGIAQAELANQQQLAQAPVIAGLYNQAYGQGLGEFNAQQQVGVGAQEATGWLGQNAGFGLASLGNQAQNSALTGANAQLQSGALQQQLGQEQLNVPYEQFLQQQAYPFQTTGWESGIASGLGSGSGGTGSTSYPGASTASQVAGLGLTGLSGLGMTGAFGKNGYLSGLFGAGNGLSGALAPGVGAQIGTATALDAGAYAAASDFAPAAALALIAKGGRINANDRPHRDAGGSIGQQNLPPIPDLSASYIPQAGMQSGHMGPPQAPQAPKADDPIKDSMQAIGMANSLEKMIPGMARGGHAGFAPGGIAGYTLAPGRDNIEIPVLNTADGVSGSNMAGFHPVPQTQANPLPANLTSNFASNPASFTPNATTSGVRTTIPNNFSLLNSGATAPANLTSSGPAIPATGIGTPLQTPADVSEVLGREGVYNNLADGGSVSPMQAGMGFSLGGHYDMGGDVTAGLSNSGVPGAMGGNPITNNAYSQFSQLPLEKLQELAVRIPPGSQQGQIIQKAMQAKRMAPQPGMAQGTPNPTVQPFGQAPQAISGLSFPGLAAGGRAGFDAAGAVGRDAVDTTDVPPPSQYAADMKEVSPGMATTPADANAVGMRNLAAWQTHGGNIPTEAPTDTASHPSAVPVLALNGDHPTGSHPVSGEPTGSLASPHDKSVVSGFANSPWLPVLTAGLGMLAGRSPQAGVNIGQGGLEGIKTLMGQQTAQRAQQQTDQTADFQKGQLENSAKQIQQTGDYQTGNLKHQAAALAELGDYHKNQNDIETQHNQNQADQIRQTGQYQQGELGLKGKELDLALKKLGGEPAWKYNLYLQNHKGDPGMSDANGQPTPQLLKQAETYAQGYGGTAIVNGQLVNRNDATPVGAGSASPAPAGATTPPADTGRAGPPPANAAALPNQGAAVTPATPAPTEYHPAGTVPVKQEIPDSPIPKLSNPQHQEAQAQSEAIKNATGNAKIVDVAARGALARNSELGTMDTLFRDPAVASSRLAPAQETAAGWVYALTNDAELAQTIFHTDPTKAEVLQKATTQMGLKFAKETEGAREAVQAIKIALGANPSSAMTREAALKIIGIMKGANQRSIDMQQYQQAWLEKNHSYLGFEPWFNQNHSVEEYTSKVLPHQVPRGSDGKIDASQLAPNVTYDIPGKGTGYWTGSKFQPWGA